MTQIERTYDPGIFMSPRTVDEAKAVILTPEDNTVEKRWAEETPYLADLMLDHIQLGTLSRVMDYGCGIGRMSLELTARTDCRVYGVDISPNMRALAAGYVASPYFVACAPEAMVDLPKMDAIISVWCIQHIPLPEQTIVRLIEKLKPRGRMFVVNSYRQCFPIGGGQWLMSDDTSVLALFRMHMNQIAFEPSLSIEHTSPLIAGHAWWGVFEAKG